MSVPTVPMRSLKHFGTRSCNRSLRSHPLKGGNVGNADPAKNRLVPMPLFLSGGVTGGQTVPFSLPTFWEKIRGVS